jgi:hypothetical protein
MVPYWSQPDDSAYVVPERDDRLRSATVVQEQTNQKKDKQQHQRIAPQSEAPAVEVFHGLRVFS